MTIIDIPKNSTVLKEFIRFCIVGVLCTLIDALGFYATYEIVGYKLALVIGFVISIVLNSILNLKWSFSTKFSLENILGLLAANCFNIFVVRMSLMWMFINLWDMEEGIAFIPTLVISVFTNFIIVRLLVMKRPTSRS